MDVLYLSQIRHAEDLEACLRVAQNALVLVVIHALSPEMAIEQMIQAFPPDMQDAARTSVGNSLICVTNQRLLPKANSPGRVAAYGVFTPDRVTCARVARIPNLSSIGFSRGQQEAPPGYSPIVSHIEKLRVEGAINEKTAKEAIAEC